MIRNQSINSDIADISETSGVHMDNFGGVTAAQRRRNVWFFAAVSIVLILLGGWCLSYALVGSPVASKLAADSRNEGYTLRAHYGRYVDRSTLVLDLVDLKSAAPIDLFRGLFQSAEALNALGREFTNVHLARRGKTVFVMKGEDFKSIGSEFAAGQNPVYLIRTLPEKLYHPNGDAAFPHWEGGLLGVVGKQMDDVNAMARRWSEGG